MASEFTRNDTRWIFIRCSIVRRWTWNVKDQADQLSPITFSDYKKYQNGVVVVVIVVVVVV